VRKIRQNDTVEVISGEHKGVRGEVMRVAPKAGRVVVRGVNLVKVHERRTRERDGGIIEREAPLHVSNVALVCPNCDKPTRVGLTELEDGKRARYCKACSEIIE